MSQQQSWMFSRNVWDEMSGWEIIWGWFSSQGGCVSTCQTGATVNLLSHLRWSLPPSTPLSIKKRTKLPPKPSRWAQKHQNHFTPPSQSCATHSPMRKPKSTFTPALLWPPLRVARQGCTNLSQGLSVPFLSCEALATPSQFPRSVLVFFQEQWHGPHGHRHQIVQPG
jgi:hypothetical protein